jgi:hypothetical protein
MGEETSQQRATETISRKRGDYNNVPAYLNAAFTRWATDANSVI